LERGRYSLTAHNEPSKQIKKEELTMLLEGLSYSKMSQKKRFKFG
jgi:hypothetical protein